MLLPRCLTLWVAMLVAMSSTVQSFAEDSSFDVTDISSRDKFGCVVDQINGSTRLTGCLAGRNIISIQGRFMPADDIKVWIGDWPVLPDSITRPTNQSIDITLPIIDTQAGVYYDIKIVSKGQATLLKSVVNMVSTPQIAGVTACVSKYTAMPPPNWQAFCLEGETFSFSGVNLHGRTAPRVWFGPYECPNVQIINDRSIRCTVPRDPDGTASVPHGLYLSWPDHNSTVVPFELWDYPLAPRVTAINSPSCYQSSDLDKPLQCLYDSVKGLGLTVQTTRLVPSQLWTCMIYYRRGASFGTENVLVDEASGKLTCSLPSQWRRHLDDDTVFHFVVAVRGQSDDEGSNVKSLVLVQQISYDTSSSDSNALTIALCVVLPLLALVVAIVWYRRHRNVTKLNESFGLGGRLASDEYKDIELV